MHLPSLQLIPIPFTYTCAYTQPSLYLYSTVGCFLNQNSCTMESTHAKDTQAIPIACNPSPHPKSNTLESTFLYPGIERCTQPSIAQYSDTVLQRSLQLFTWVCYCDVMSRATFRIQRVACITFQCAYGWQYQHTSQARTRSEEKLFSFGHWIKIRHALQEFINS